jgi:hypothetical protein
MRILIGSLFIFLSIQSSAQILKNLKDRAINKARENTVDKAKNEARNAYHKQLNDIRDGFDSTDFDYAILVSDNSGLFDVKDKKQFGSKFLI